MKKIRVFGHTEVTVSVVVSFRDDTEITMQKILRKADKQFGGIQAYLGNGGDDKLIGVEGDNETIAADSVIVFDDYMEEY